MAGFIPEYPVKRQGGITVSPWCWCGDAAIDGAAGDWALAPLGSEYTRINAGNVAKSIKKAATSATSDWKAITTAA